MRYINPRFTLHYITDTPMVVAAVRFAPAFVRFISARCLKKSYS